MTLEQALRALGMKAEDIALTLKELGCYGRPKLSSCCPVAQYLKGQGFIEPRVADYFCSAIIGDYPIREQVDLPKPVIEFIRRFDQKEFPELIG